MKPDKRGGARPGAGRKPVKLDLELLEKLSAIGCTLDEIAAVAGCSTRTIEKIVKREPYAEVLARGRAKTRISVRHQQMKLLDAGNAAMAIFLGKVLLGQREISSVEVSGPNGKSMFDTETIDAILALIKTTNRQK